MADMDRDRLIDAYIDHVLEHGKPPVTVWKFCKGVGIAEVDFYKLFSSLSVLEASIWGNVVSGTIETLNADEDYAGYSAREKWLAFTYTYLENLKNYRTFALVRCPSDAGRLCCKRLQKMETAFTEFAESGVEAGNEDGSIADRGRLLDLYPRAFFGHVLWITQFFLDDESEGFERTDAAIEKSVNLAFDLTGNQVLDSIFDFARFIIGKPAQ